MLSSDAKGATMKNTLLRAARLQNRWSQQQLADFADVSLSTVERAERGEPSRVDNIERLCACLQKTPEQLGLINIEDYEVNRRQANKTIAGLVSGLLLTSSTGQINPSLLAGLWTDDLLATYARGIAACQDLYYNGSPHQVEAILPLYCNQTVLLAQQPSLLQQSAAKLASQAQQLACELATDREDFGEAQRTGQQAFLYAQLADDANLQVAALISLANLGFHRKLSAAALRAYKHAVSLLDRNVTPLLKGRTYAGIAEVYAMRGQFQEAMRAMGLAYEHYPMKPEDDPAYPYLRASRYSLYVFGDAQSRLFLKQPKEADKALIAMQKETNDPQIEPVTKLDMLYYQAEVQIQQGELEPSSTILTEAATLAKDLGSRLYFNKLAIDYHELQTQWPKEPLVAALEEVFQPW
jgi:transcriptional regulator with XRE-family HTH domain